MASSSAKAASAPATDSSPGATETRHPDIATADGVWNQNKLTATLRYTGTLTDISHMRPLFGTDGVAIPEPSTAALLAFGLVGLVWRGRKTS